MFHQCICLTFNFVATTLYHIFVFAKQQLSLMHYSFFIRFLLPYVLPILIFGHHKYMDIVCMLDYRLCNLLIYSYSQHHHYMLSYNLIRLDCLSNTLCRVYICAYVYAILYKPNIYVSILYMYLYYIYIYIGCL